MESPFGDKPQYTKDGILRRRYKLDEQVPQVDDAVRKIIAARRRGTLPISVEYDVSTSSVIVSDSHQPGRYSNSGDTILFDWVVRNYPDGIFKEPWLQSRGSGQTRRYHQVTEYVAALDGQPFYYGGSGFNYLPAIRVAKYEWHVHRHLPDGRYRADTLDLDGHGKMRWRCQTCDKPLSRTQVKVFGLGDR